MMIGIVIIFLASFERKETNIEIIVLLAIMTALAVVGRIAFVSLGSIQLASLIIIVTGIVFGKEMGFMTGALCALITGLILGFGIWVVIQMFAWGMMGFVAGLLAKKLTNNRYLQATYGLIAGILYGWITNISVFQFMTDYSITSIIGIYVASIPLDLLHGATNFVALIILGPAIIEILNRIAIKYGIKEAEETAIQQ